MWTLQHAGHVIYTDNFYTSPVLAKYLFSKDTYLCGTVRPDRKGFPRTLVQKKRDIKRLDRGHTEWKECGGMVATAWKDKRMVYYISTFHAPEQPGLTTQRRQKDGAIVQLQCPPAAAAYSQFMGGVDRLDEMTRMNKSKKCMKWYRRVKKKILETSIHVQCLCSGRTCDTQATRLSEDHDATTSHSSWIWPMNWSATSTWSDHLSGGPRSDCSSNLRRLDHTDHWPVKGEGKDHGCVVCYARHVRYKDANPNPTPLMPTILASDGRRQSSVRNATSTSAAMRVTVFKFTTLRCSFNSPELNQ